MKPAPFEYLRPATLAEACAALEGDMNARVLAGGQTLIPMLNMRLARPSLLVDIANIGELAGVEDADDHIHIGAMTRQQALENDAVIDAKLPLLRLALPWIGHPPTRARGTIGGSLANGDPAAELPLVAVTLEAEIIFAESGDVLTEAAREFYFGPMITALPDAAILTGVRFPVWDTLQTGAGFAEVNARKSDFAFVAAAAQISLNIDGTIARAALGIGGYGDVPLALEEIEKELPGTPFDPARAADLIAAALEGEEAADDLTVSAGYRRRVAIELGCRALRDAVASAEARHED